MDKLAQRRSMRSKIWEAVNLPGKGLEKWHDELAAVMDDMRSVDERIREIADDVRPLMRQARSALRQRKYLDTAFAISEFHRRVRQVSTILSKFNEGVQIKHHNFLLENFDEPNREALFGYDPNAELKEACIDFDTLLKEAGPLDWAVDKALRAKNVVKDIGTNVVTQKGRGRWALERIFSASSMKEVKDMTTKLVDRSEKMLHELLSSFDILESGVSGRKPDLYIKQANKFIAKFNAYHAEYLKYDEKVLQPLRQHQDALKKLEQDKEQQEVEEARKSSLVTPYIDEPIAPSKAPQMNEWLEGVRKLPSDIPADTKVPFLERRNPPPIPREPTFDEWGKDPKVFDKAMQQAKEYNDYVNKQKLLDKLEQDRLEMEENQKSPFITPFVEPPQGKPPLPYQGKAAHQDFLDRLTTYAAQEDPTAFLTELLDYSATLEETDTDVSVQLLTMASEIVEAKTAGVFDMFKGKVPEELPGIPAPKKKVERPTLEMPPKPVERPTLEMPPKPTTLPKVLESPKQQEYPSELLKSKTQPLDLPEDKIAGKIYKDIPMLASIGISHMRIIPEISDDIIDTLSHNRIQILPNKLDVVLKKAIYDSVLIRISPVFDIHNPSNPYDKHIDMLVRLYLSDLNPNIDGVVKLSLKGRLSATHKTLTIHKLREAPKIELRSKAPAPKIQETIPEDNDEDSDQYDDYASQYDE